MENKNIVIKIDTESKKESVRERERRTGAGAEAEAEEDCANKAVGAKLQRIVVSNESRAALKTIIERVNDGFSGGRVNLTEIANWIILRFQHGLDEAQINEIRSEHFDEVAMLESILKEAKASGKVPTDFKSLLQKQLGLNESPKRKSKAALT